MTFSGDCSSDPGSFVHRCTFVMPLSRIIRVVCSFTAAVTARTRKSDSGGASGVGADSDLILLEFRLRKREALTDSTGVPFGRQFFGDFLRKTFLQRLLKNTTNRAAVNQCFKLKKKKNLLYATPKWSLFYEIAKKTKTPKTHEKISWARQIRREKSRRKKKLARNSANRNKHSHQN